MHAGSSLLVVITLTLAALLSPRAVAQTLPKGKLAGTVTPVAYRIDLTGSGGRSLRLRYGVFLTASVLRSHARAVSFAGRNGRTTLPPPRESVPEPSASSGLQDLQP